MSFFDDYMGSLWTSLDVTQKQQEDVIGAFTQGLEGLYSGISDAPGWNIQEEREKAQSQLEQQYRTNAQGVINEAASRKILGSRAVGSALGAAGQGYATGLGALETSLLEKQQDIWKEQQRSRETALGRITDFANVNFGLPYGSYGLGTESASNLAVPAMSGWQEIVSQYTDPATGNVDMEMLWTDVGAAAMEAAGYNPNPAECRAWGASIMSTLAQFDYTPGTYTLEDGTILHYDGGNAGWVEFPNGVQYDLFTMGLMEQGGNVPHLPDPIDPSTWNQIGDAVMDGNNHRIVQSGSDYAVEVDGEYFKVAFDTSEVWEDGHRVSVLDGQNQVIAYMGVGGSLAGQLFHADMQPLGNWSQPAPDQQPPPTTLPGQPTDPPVATVTLAEGGGNYNVSELPNGNLNIDLAGANYEVGTSKPPWDTGEGGQAYPISDPDGYEVAFAVSGGQWAGKIIIVDADGTVSVVGDWQ